MKRKLCLCINYTFITGYVGAATVAGAAWWFLYDPSGPGVTYYQLVSNYLFVTNTSSQAVIQLKFSSCAVPLHAVPRRERGLCRH